MFLNVKECIAKLVQKEQHFSLTTDIWLSDSLDSYLSFTGHWIDSNWENKECCLHAQPFNERHTGENIVTVFTICLDTWNITDKLHVALRDSGSNFVAGFRNADILSCACFAHTLQLTIKDGILSQRSVELMLSTSRKIVGRFKQSNVSLHALSSAQSKLELCQHRPVQDEPTRWNSSYYMLQWFMEQKPAILAVSTEISLPTQLTNAQWQLMGKVLQVLKPFEEAT
uniref:Zinc finger BED domain-containing protein 4 n=1 Tax=Amphimedon queenslandica TaxID=400682 RepID=A0A1X7UWW1_AMPQE